jgi:hypothetical protein
MGQIMYWSDNNCAAKVGDILKDYILADWHSCPSSVAEPRTAPVIAAINACGMTAAEVPTARPVAIPTPAPVTECSFCGAVCTAVHADRVASVKEVLLRVFKFTPDDFNPVVGVAAELRGIYTRIFGHTMDDECGLSARVFLRLMKAVCSAVNPTHRDGFINFAQTMILRDDWVTRHDLTSFFGSQQ